MTAQELRDKFNMDYGLDKQWPTTYMVDAETYGFVCQSVFSQTYTIPELVEKYRSGWLGKIAFGPNNGIMFKNVELILKP